MYLRRMVLMAVACAGLPPGWLPPNPRSRWLRFLRKDSPRKILGRRGAIEAGETVVALGRLP